MDIVRPAFPLPTTASPTLQGTLGSGFGNAVVACDMPEPFEFPSHDSCQKRFLRTNKEDDLARHPVFGLMLQVGEADEYESPLSLKERILNSSGFMSAAPCLKKTWNLEVAGSNPISGNPLSPSPFSQSPGRRLGVYSFR